jgi:hypothetical protein
VLEKGGCLRTCTKCNTEKDESEFYEKGKSHGDSWCKACRRADSKRWREQNPKKFRQQLKSWRERNPNSGKEWRELHPNYSIEHAYDLTKNEWDALFEKQGRCCAICKATSPSGIKNGRWHTDHDHETGEVRGILCGNCNLGLGNFKDNPSLLRSAVAYLERQSVPCALRELGSQAA